MMLIYQKWLVNYSILINMGPHHCQIDFLYLFEIWNCALTYISLNIAMLFRWSCDNYHNNNHFKHSLTLLWSATLESHRTQCWPIFTLDLCHNSELCHIQNADDINIVGCIRDENEEEYQSLVLDFTAWCLINHLQLNNSKTKDLVIDFGRSKLRPQPVLIKGAEVETVESYKYLGLWLNNKLDWTIDTRHLYTNTWTYRFVQLTHSRDTVQ